jgi:hypothetical protein
MVGNGIYNLRTLAELAGHEKPSFTAEKYLPIDGTRVKI